MAGLGARTLSVATLAMLGGCIRSPEARAENWWSARTEHIHLETDAGAETTARTARRLEEIRHALTLAFYHCGRTEDGVLEVVVLSHEDEYDELFGDGSRGIAFRPTEGLLALPALIVIEGTSGLDRERTFAHEIVHGLVRCCFPDAPRWLHEGLASVFENVERRADVVVAGAPAYVVSDSAYFDRVEIDGFPATAVPRRYVPTPTALLALDPSTFSDEDPHLTSGHYAGAWALTHLLALGPDAALRQRFRSYLDALVHGSDSSAAAFEVAFYGVDLDGALARYLAAGTFARVVRPWDGYEVPMPAAIALTTTAAHRRLAELELRQRGVDSAVAARAVVHLDLAELDPAERTRALLVRAALGLGDPGASVRTAAAERPDGRDELRALVLVEVGAGNVGAAIDAALRLAVHPDRRSADLAVVSDVEREAGRLDEALGHAAEAVALDATDALAWLALGRAQLATGDRAAARRSLRTAMNFATHGSSIPHVAAAALRGIDLGSAGATAATPIGPR